MLCLDLVQLMIFQKLENNIIKTVTGAHLQSATTISAIICRRQRTTVWYQK
uniref:Uncharacterized protein n=1 Tax=Rhizophora mucronata TaxID=61149 RepID=A0A2P2LND4_RHIMU